VTSPLERLREVVATGRTIAPVHAAFGTRLDAVEPGRASGRIPALPPSGLRWPGAVPVLGDLVLSVAITATLPAGRGITTLTLATTVLGPLPAAGEPLLATGELVHAGRATAVSRACAHAADGRPVAHLTARCALVPAAGEPPDAVSPDPRPDPFADLVTATPAVPALANSSGGVQGGVLAAVLGDRIAAATEGPAEPADLEVTFLRPVAADGAALATRVELVHAGRRLVAARAELLDASGRVAAVASGTAWRG
jgi:acyl-coenzyme A thioesterase PaaI-like protein